MNRDVKNTGVTHIAIGRSGVLGQSSKRKTTNEIGLDLRDSHNSIISPVVTRARVIYIINSGETVTASRKSERVNARHGLQILRGNAYPAVGISISRVQRPLRWPRHV